jgi:uncharacterized protein (TIGR00725 family)
MAPYGLPMVFKIIGVIGANRPDRATYQLAEEVGREIAKSGAALVCGGLGGVMEAVCKGARDGDGLTIGIIPSDFRDDANRYVQIPIVTGMGIGRNVMLVKTADAVIAVGGGFGTLSEIAHALNIGKTVVGLGTWNLESAFDKPIPNMLKAETPRQAVQMALEAINAKR